MNAASVDILENRVLVVIDHDKAEKELLANFSGVPVTASPDKVLKNTAVRSDVPDPISLIAAKEEKVMGPALAPAPAAEAPMAKEESQEVSRLTDKVMAATSGMATKANPKAAEPAAEPRWADSMESKLVVVTVFVALMLVLLIALKSWRKVATKTLAPGQDFSLKTLATHALGPKQRISVIQVGQEQILLGISPDGINFLTSLKQTTDAPRMHLDPSMYQKTLSPTPRAPVRDMGAEPLATKHRNPETRPSSAARSEARSDKAEPGSSIRYGVGDEGVKNFKGSARDQESLEDVTRMIRKKLKDLPKV
ncbi:MAG: hypothetical protein EOP07_16390 [Proteobacteria bacterium]|nr:MAG: hypothetical protein EOP07_16390 [Pseudomonadota bacterium]